MFLVLPSEKKVQLLYYLKNVLTSNQITKEIQDKHKWQPNAQSIGLCPRTVVSTIFLKNTGHPMRYLRGSWYRSRREVNGQHKNRPLSGSVCLTGDDPFYLFWTIWCSDVKNNKEIKYIFIKNILSIFRKYHIPWPCGEHEVKYNVENHVNYIILK